MKEKPRVIHAQLYDGGWLVKVELNGYVFTGTGLTEDDATAAAMRFARRKSP